MVDKVKSTDIPVLSKEPPAILTENPIVKEVVSKVPDADSVDVIALKKQLSDAEEKAKNERDKRIEAEKSRDESNNKVVSSQTEAVRAHEASINSSLEVATGNVAQIKRELREAMEGGDLEKQVDLQEKLADARWAYKNVENTKKQFEDWKEKQKNNVSNNSSTQTAKYTANEQAWIDAHPRFETDDDYYAVVAGADASAKRKGIQPDTKAYYEHVENALKKSGMEDNKQEDDSGRDTTGSQEEDVVEVVVKKPVRAAVSAPASYSAPTSSANTNRNSKQFKLTPEMQGMAHHMFGPSSSHKLTERQAEEKYAAYQIDIRDRRANGEKV